MKRSFKSYFAAWAVVLVLFNIIVFAVNDFDLSYKEAPFWLGYALITIMFIGQLICGYVSVKDNNATKTFYRLSLVSACYTGLISSFITGTVSMMGSEGPLWFFVILCAVCLAFNALAIIKAAAAVGEVERIDKKIKQQTFFIKALTVDANNLLARAQSDVAKAECKKVYETVRYSDPMSSDMLASVESQITLKFAELTKAVLAADDQAITAAAADVVILVNDRNNKCKLLK